jgi:hypothetical protein
MTPETPNTSGNENSAALTEVVRAVLLVARLGETDRRSWWGTQSFGAAGRVVLKQRLPRTWRMAAVELDVAAARTRHDEIIERANAVHLFSDNWPVRRWASAWLAEQKTADPPDDFFNRIEVAADEEIADLLRVPGPKPAISSNAVRVGAVQRDAFESIDELAASVRTLASVYADMDAFAVPHLDLVE